MSIIDPADHDEIRRDLATANRLLATVLNTFTHYETDGTCRSEWVRAEDVAEWRAIAGAVAR